jgi:hypothetical protein
MNYPQGVKKGGDTFRKWFRHGHQEVQLVKAGEPEETVAKVVAGTYTKADEVREKMKESNSN